MARAPNGMEPRSRTTAASHGKWSCSVVTAIVMSLLGLFGNWVTHGGLIGLLGGVTATELLGSK